jgi:hypothetical protein
LSPDGPGKSEADINGFGEWYFRVSPERRSPVNEELETARAPGFLSGQASREDLNQ